MKGCAVFVFSAGAPFTSRDGHVVVPYNGVIGAPSLMKLGITGSRSITEFDFMPYFMMKDKDFRAFCRKHGLGRRKITKVISGGAKGIDSIAFQTAEAAGIRNLQFLPDRKKFPGKLVLKAFQERNKLIVDSCDILLAVWDGKSRGTKNTLAYAQSIHKSAFLIEFRQGSRKSS